MKWAPQNITQENDGLAKVRGTYNSAKVGAPEGKAATGIFVETDYCSSSHAAFASLQQSSGCLSLLYKKQTPQTILRYVSFHTQNKRTLVEE